MRKDLPDLVKVIVYDMEGLRHFSDPMVMSFDEFLAMGEAFDRQNPNLLDRRIGEIKPDDVAKVTVDLFAYDNGT